VIYDVVRKLIANMIFKHSIRNDCLYAFDNCKKAHRSPPDAHDGEEAVVRNKQRINKQEVYLKKGFGFDGLSK